jgi:hypothetical protein
MVVTVTVMNMMQMAAHQVVCVVAVGDGLMTAAGTMSVAFVVSSATVFGGTIRWIKGTNGKLVIVNMVSVFVMQMAIMQIVGVAVMVYGGVTAAGFVLVGVLRMNLTGFAHG